MRVTPYGKDVVRTVVIFCVVLGIIAFFLSSLIVKILLVVFALFLLGFTFYFFRDPEVIHPEFNEHDDILSPADGKIVVIEDVRVPESGYGIFNPHEEVKQVSIFLSPLNVHVNRYPVSGTLKHFRYIPGKYLVAFNHKASEKNERTELGIETDSGKKVLFKQIAGFVARRIVCPVEVGYRVKAGERFGMIKFGSRVDIIMSRETEVLVKIGDVVTSGVTIIAKM